MLLVIATIAGTDYRISMDGLALAHWWDDKILSFTAPKRQLSAKYGGYAKMSFGSIELLPDLFSEAWPPPVEIGLAAYYTETDEAAKSFMFSGVGRLKTHAQASLTYDIYADAPSINLLLTAIGYDGSTVAIPRAFGAIVHATPVRLPDQNGHQCYGLGDLQGVLHTNWHAYLNGVDCCASVINAGGNKFEFVGTPSGALTISGTGFSTTLRDIFTWACGVSLLNLPLDHAHDRTLSPAINYWATEQMLMTAWLGEIAAWSTHLYHIDAAGVHLMAMETERSIIPVTEWDYISAPYEYQPPIAAIASTVQTSDGITSLQNTRAVTLSSNYGQQMTVKAYTDLPFDIDAGLSDIGAIMQRPVIKMAMPMHAVMPTIGDRLSWTDESYYAPVYAWMMVREIVYDFDRDEAILSGDGGID